MGPRAGLDVLEKRKICCLYRIRALGCPVRSLFAILTTKQQLSGKRINYKNLEINICWIWVDILKTFNMWSGASVSLNEAGWSWAQPKRKRDLARVGVINNPVIWHYENRRSDVILSQVLTPGGQHARLSVLKKDSCSQCLPSMQEVCEKHYQVAAGSQWRIFCLADVCVCWDITCWFPSDAVCNITKYLHFFTMNCC